MRLADLGWDPTLAYYAQEIGEPDLVPGRLVTIDRGSASVATEMGSLVQARWRYPVPIEGETEGVVPAVGDWAMISRPLESSKLRTLLPRRTLLARGVGKGARIAQPLAANVDLVLVVIGLDGDFSLRRIERFLALARSGSVRALIVLNKADLVETVEAAVDGVKALVSDQPVLPVSTVTGRGLEELKGQIGPGDTVVLVGSSGVGKSTLINRLLGREHQLTGAVRATDDRGRHVTTRRELLRLPSGGLVIDTPGLREVGLLANADGVLAVFPEIAELAQDCRFSDCTHDREPECAVREAVAKGRLDADRLESYRRLVREENQAARRANEHVRRAHERSTVGQYRRYLRESHRFKGRES